MFLNSSVLNVFSDMTDLVTVNTVLPKVSKITVFVKHRKNKKPGEKISFRQIHILQLL